MQAQRQDVPGWLESKTGEHRSLGERYILRLDVLGIYFGARLIIQFLNELFQVLGGSVIRQLKVSPEVSSRLEEDIDKQATGQLVPTSL